MYRKIAAAALVALALALPASAARTREEQRNLKIATDFYNAGFNEKNWEKAKTFMTSTYVQHSIYMEDGPEGLRKLIQRIQAEYPQNRGEIKRSFVNGDIVVLHVHVTRHPKHRGWSVMEMMRVADGKVIEHWDMFQPVPEKPANANGMF